MTDPQPTEATVTIASQAIELALTGKPDVKNKWGAGSIRPRFVVFTYLPEGIRAHLYGVWVREDGELTDAPCDQDYRIGDTDEWPDWMAELARQHKPADPAALRQQVIDGLREARRPGLGGMSEAEAVAYMADAVLRRMADETQQPEDEAPVAAAEGGLMPSLMHLPPCVADMLTALAVAVFTGAWAFLATLNRTHRPNRTTPEA
jgi:hypothetical protein